MAHTFDFLKETNPKLYRYGNMMERDFFTDTLESAHHGSEFLDEFVEEIYAREKMPYPHKSFFTRNVDELERQGIISPKIRGMLEKAKLLGDFRFEEIGLDDRVLSMHNTLIELASWFFNRYETIGR